MLMHSGDSEMIEVQATANRQVQYSKDKEGVVEGLLYLEAGIQRREGNGHFKAQVYRLRSYLERRERVNLDEAKELYKKNVALLSPFTSELRDLGGSRIRFDLGNRYTHSLVL